MVTLIWDGPVAVRESQYGIALGYYVDCDTAVCRNDVPAGFADGDYSEWPGFEGWESPIAIFNDTESDTPTHCSVCGAVIAHDLTTDGTRYVMDSITEFISSDGHTPDVMAQWWDAYGDTLDDSDLREIIERAMVAHGARSLESEETRTMPDLTQTQG